jgi:choline-sulfatase
MYPKEDVPLRANVYEDGEMAYDEHWFKVYLWDYLYYQRQDPRATPADAAGQPLVSEYLEPAFDLPPGFDLRDLTALYRGMVSYTDTYLGKVVDALKETGFLEDTLLVFTSDHGDNLGSHQLFNKSQLYEEAIRVPLLYSWPGTLEPQHNTAQVTSLVDVMPTVLDCAGIAPPEEVQGHSVADVLRGEGEAVAPNQAFVEIGRGEIGVRTPQRLLGMKLADDLRTIEDERLCYYDLTQDPYQHHNITADDPLRTELAAKLVAWNAATPWMGE